MEGLQTKTAGSATVERLLQMEEATRRLILANKESRPLDFFFQKTNHNPSLELALATPMWNMRATVVMLTLLT